MDREQAKEYIKNNPQIILTPDGCGKGHICPVCGSGSGKNGTGIATKDNIHFTCFRGCYTHSDIIDIIGLKHGISADEHEAKFKAAYEEFGITIDGDTLSAPKAPKVQATHDTQQVQEAQEDITEYLNLCHSRVNQTDYFKRRGISQETIDRFKLGYDPAYKAHNGKWDAVVIPTSAYSCVGRNTRSDEKGTKVHKRGHSMVFNTEALYGGKPVFIVEGEIDAMSVIEAGADAVGLGSTANATTFINLLRVKPPSHTLILSLDNDEAGIGMTAKLKGELEQLEIPFVVADIAPGLNDPNEALLKDRAVFMETVQGAMEPIFEQERAEREAAIEEHLKNSAKHHMEAFNKGIKESVNTPFIPTGYEKLDRVFDGGLYEGLYAVGATSSLGKTTFVLQMADQIAVTGQDVMIFSLEMARTELMAKSISRLTFAHCPKGKTHQAKTTRGITSGFLYHKYSQEERELIKVAMGKYEEYADKIFIHEGVGDIGAKQIKQDVAKHIRITDRKPVVIIDYLQLLESEDKRGTDKQNMDKAVMELKRLSRDYKIPVIVISSFNRGSYHAQAAMESFKESGGIDYTCDVILGLHFKGTPKPEAGKDGTKQKVVFDSDEAKKKDPREIELKVLKNRNGKTGDTIEYEFYTLFNLFKER